MSKKSCTFAAQRVCVDKISKKQAEVTIKKDVDKEKTDLIREWIIDTNSKGIKIDESVKRFYPNII